MTGKQSEELKNLATAIGELSIKLFGNGSVNGCIDNRLEHVELYISELREIMPKMVTREHCDKRHEVRWSKIMLIIGLAGTWIGLLLRAMEVL